MNKFAVGQFWINGPDLRQRWGRMPRATFYWRLNRGLLPKPKYPFGEFTPYWEMAVIEAFEKEAA